MQPSNPPSLQNLVDSLSNFRQQHGSSATSDPRYRFLLSALKHQLSDQTPTSKSSASTSQPPPPHYSVDSFISHSLQLNQDLLPKSTNYSTTQLPTYSQLRHQNKVQLRETQYEQKLNQLANLYHGQNVIQGGGPFTDQFQSVLSLNKLSAQDLQNSVRRRLMSNVIANEESSSMIRIAKSAQHEKYHKIQRGKQSQNFTGLIHSHRNAMIDRSRVVHNTIHRLNKDVEHYWEKVRKEEAENREVMQKQRLAALKEDNAEAYFELLEKAKNDRLIELLRQTDDCLKALGAQLVQSRDTSSADVPAIDIESEFFEDGTDTTKYNTNYRKFVANQNFYYQIAHRTREKVDRQPSSLKHGELKPYQLTGLQWLVSLYNNKLNGILADEMGLGKTIQTISLICYLMEYKNNHGPHLVIVPLGTLENWRLEFNKWAPHVEVVVYTGNKEARKKLAHDYISSNKFHVILTQYEYITRDKRVLGRVKWNYIIMDEGHRIKNANCKLVLTLKEYSSHHRLLLTGTPLQNDLKELWSLLHFLLPSVFESIESFEGWFNSPFDQKSKVSMNEEEILLVVTRLHQVLRPFLLRRVKDDVLDQLPEKVEHILHCDISAYQKKLYTQIQARCRIVVSQTAQGAPKAKALNNTLIQLRKVANHPYLFRDEYDIDEDLIRASGKVALLDDILYKLHSTGHRVLLFCQMTQMLDVLEYYCNFREYKYLRLDGNVKADERGPLLKRFNEKDSPYFIFLLSTRAGGLGLNLQSADTVILYDSDWNPQQDLQAMARAHRIGQTKSVRVFTFCSITPVEEKILARAKEKRSTEMQVIGAGKFNESATHAERESLLQQLISQQEEFKLDKVPTPEQLNMMIARTDEEREIFYEIDQQRQKEREVLYKKLNRAVPPKLVAEDELPQFLLDPPTPTTQTSTVLDEDRKKKRVNYFTDISEDQFDNLMTGTVTYDDLRHSENVGEFAQEEDTAEDEYAFEDPGVEEEEEFARPKPGKRKRQSSKPSKDGEPPQKKRRGRPAGSKNGTGQKRKRRSDAEIAAQVVEDTSTGQRTRRTRKGNQPQLDEFQQSQMNVWRHVTSTIDDNTGRVLSAVFMDLPDRISFADYYDLIENPICLNDIHAKIVSGGYSWDEMDDDMQLIVANCKKYNLPTAPICEDAEGLYRAFVKEREKRME